MIKALFLDFGGVIAEEGYKNSLLNIAGRYGIQKDIFFKKCADLIYETGYIVGKNNQSGYFEAIRRHFDIKFEDSEFERIILSSFKIRKSILNIVEEIKKHKLLTAILSDQTDWLDKINESEDFFKYFDFIFNSYHINMGKREIKTFYYVSEQVSLKPQEILFIDDQMQNIINARETGINGICLTDENEIIDYLTKKLLQNNGTNH